MHLSARHHADRTVTSGTFFCPIKTSDTDIVSEVWLQGLPVGALPLGIWHTGLAHLAARHVPTQSPPTAHRSPLPPSSHLEGTCSLAQLSFETRGSGKGERWLCLVLSAAVASG